MSQPVDSANPDAELQEQVQPPPAEVLPQPPVQVAAIQIKLPPFWPQDPQLWFAQIEAQFTTRHITVSRTKFDYVIASLAPEFAVEVRDLLLNPPDETPYEVLKQELTKRTSASEHRRLQQLLTAEELGDRKPSQVLRRIQQLLGDKANSMDPTIMRELFLQRLPANVRMVLTPSAGELNLDQLAQLADRILEASPTTTVAATESITTQLTAQVNDLSRRLDELTSTLTNTINKFSRRSRSPSPWRGRRRSTTPFDEDSNLCWYHLTFGDKAKNCQPPCKKSGNFQAGR